MLGKCSRCGGDLFFDSEDRQLRCVQAGHTIDEDMFMLEVSEEGITAICKKYKISYPQLSELHKLWDFGCVKLRPSEYNDHAHEILADFRLMPVKDLEKKWGIPKGTISGLKRRWRMSGIAIPISFARLKEAKRCSSILKHK